MDRGNDFARSLTIERVPERSRRHSLERVRIEPLVDRLRTLAVADSVRQPGHQVADVIAALRDGKWTSRTAGENSAEGEAAENFRRGAALDPAPPFADG